MNSLTLTYSLNSPPPGPQPHLPLSPQIPKRSNELGAWNARKTVISLMKAGVGGGGAASPWTSEPAGPTGGGVRRGAQPLPCPGLQSSAPSSWPPKWGSSSQQVFWETPRLLRKRTDNRVQARCMLRDSRRQGRLESGPSTLGTLRPQHSVLSMVKGLGQGPGEGSTSDASAQRA